MNDEHIEIGIDLQHALEARFDPEAGRHFHAVELWCHDIEADPVLMRQSRNMPTERLIRRSIGK
jgi:hypothetical protein